MDCDCLYQRKKAHQHITVDLKHRMQIINNTMVTKRIHTIDKNIVFFHSIDPV